MSLKLESPHVTKRVVVLARRFLYFETVRKFSCFASWLTVTSHLPSSGKRPPPCMLPRQQPARRPRINYLPKRSDFMSIRRPFNPSHDEISRDRTVLLSPNRAPAFLRCTYPQQPHNRGRLCIGRANKEGRASEDALPYLGLTALSDWFILTNEGVNK